MRRRSRSPLRRPFDPVPPAVVLAAKNLFNVVEKAPDAGPAPGAGPAGPGAA